MNFENMKKTIMNFFNRVQTNVFKNRSIFEILCLFILFIFLILIIKKSFFQDSLHVEGMSNIVQEAFKEKFVHLKNDKIYDQFYSSIYDHLFYDKNKLRLELNETIEKTNIDKTSSILDIGCGTGHHLNVLHEIAGKVTGVDKSKAMVERANKKFPLLNIKHDDATNSMIFMQDSFTHITMFYFTIYCFQDQYTIFQNCYKWLKPNGYLIVHMVNRNKFDPLLNLSNPLYLVSPQKYAKERITKSTIEFEDFSYKSNFEHDPANNRAVFKEVLKCKDGDKIRSHEYELNIPKQKDLLNIAKQAGFSVIGKISMLPCQYEYQYLYILQKK